MNLECPACQSTTIKKNGHIHNGKQNYRCLSCGRQFVENPQNKLVSENTRAHIRQALLERVSLEGISRIFDVSTPWLLKFMESIIKELPDHLNASAIKAKNDIEVAIVELDEQWSYVGSKKNQQWLWLVFHTKTRQILAMHVGKRTRKSAELLLAKLPEDFKKKPSFLQINSLCTSRSFLGNNTGQLEKDRGKRVLLRDLITPSDKDALDL